MSTIKVFALGGLDKKSNDLTRSPEKASDMLNMEYDVQSSIKKRNGFELFLNRSCDDLIYYSYRDEFLLFSLSSAGLPNLYNLSIRAYKKDLTYREINTLTENNLVTITESPATISISSCEINNNIYFTSTNGAIRTLVYDGSSVRRAGLNVPYNTYDSNNLIINSGANGVFSATTGSSYYIRAFYKYTDFNGNITYGPYIQSVNKYNNGTTVSVQNFADYLVFQAGATNVTLNSSNRSIENTVNNVTGLDFSNLQPGQKILFINNSQQATLTSPTNRLFIELEVESKTTSPNNKITFTAQSLQNVSITFNASNFHYVYRQAELVIAISNSQDTGYKITRQTLREIDNGLWFLKSGTPNVFTVDDTGFSSGTLLAFEDVYDSTNLKIKPPVCKYLSAFGDQMVFGGVFGTYDLNNRYIVYDGSDLISYSDISTGDGPENTSPLNIQKIGETRDGEITGLKRCNDSLIVFKKRGVFSIDGVLISGEYQLRKINTNFVGCTSHKSILESDDGVYFQGHNGVYFTNAIGVKKLTYEIDSVFGSADYSFTRAVRLKKKQKALFYVPELSKIVVIDYYYNQIYFWDSINASKGFVEDSSGDVYFSNGTNIYRFNNGYLDDTQPINAYYSTTWHHAGEPSLNKKWLSMRVFALTDDAFTATIKTEGNWDTAQLTTNTMQFSSSDQTKFLMLDMQTKRSLRITFSNNVKKETSPGSNIFIGENLAITGYELTFEKFNDVDKN